MKFFGIEQPFHIFLVTAFKYALSSNSHRCANFLGDTKEYKGWNQPASEFNPKSPKLVFARTPDLHDEPECIHSETSSANVMVGKTSYLPGNLDSLSR